MSTPRFSPTAFILPFLLLLLISSCQPAERPPQAGITFTDGDMCILNDVAGESNCTPAMDRVFMLAGAGEQLAAMSYPGDFREVLPWQGGKVLYRGKTLLSEFEFAGNTLICRPGEGEIGERTEIALGNRRSPFLFLDGDEVILGEICQNGKDLYPAFDIYDVNEIHVTAEEIGGEESGEPLLISDTGDDEEEKEEGEVEDEKKAEVKRNVSVNNGNSDGVNVVVLENIDVGDDWTGMTFKVKPPVLPPLLPIVDVLAVKPILPQTPVAAAKANENMKGNNGDDLPLPVADDGFCGDSGSEMVCNVLFNYKDQEVHLLQCGATLQVVVDGGCRCAINLANVCELCISRVFISDDEVELRIRTSVGCTDAVRATCP